MRLIEKILNKCGYIKEPTEKLPTFAIGRQPMPMQPQPQVFQVQGQLATMLEAICAGAPHLCIVGVGNEIKTTINGISAEALRIALMDVCRKNAAFKEVLTDIIIDVNTESETENAK